ncbi:MAG: hypothetical protein H6Q74_774 [Firmicutes bacterium]|nr:hypothetical protein [Bacillota bacterium]
MIVVSACLAGVECRYNGQNFAIPEIVELVKKGQAIPICPEVLGKLSTPRPSVEQCKGKFLTQSGDDVTAEFLTGARVATEIAKLVGSKKAILKSKSPSCGCGMIYDGTFTGKLINGDGVFCKFLKEENIQVFTEDER